MNSKSTLSEIQGHFASGNCKYVTNYYKNNAVDARSLSMWNLPSVQNNIPADKLASLCRTSRYETDGSKYSSSSQFMPPKTDAVVESPHLQIGKIPPSYIMPHLDLRVAQQKMIPLTDSADIKSSREKINFSSLQLAPGSYPQQIQHTDSESPKTNASVYSCLTPKELTEENLFGTNPSNVHSSKHVSYFTGEQHRNALESESTEDSFTQECEKMVSALCDSPKRNNSNTPNKTFSDAVHNINTCDNDNRRNKVTVAKKEDCTDQLCSCISVSCDYYNQTSIVNKEKRFSECLIKSCTNMRFLMRNLNIVKAKDLKDLSYSEELAWQSFSAGGAMIESRDSVFREINSFLLHLGRSWNAIRKIFKAPQSLIPNENIFHAYNNWIDISENLVFDLEYHLNALSGKRNSETTNIDTKNKSNTRLELSYKNNALPAPPKLISNENLTSLPTYSFAPQKIALQTEHNISHIDKRTDINASSESVISRFKEQSKLNMLDSKFTQQESISKMFFQNLSKARENASQNCFKSTKCTQNIPRNIVQNSTNSKKACESHGALVSKAPHDKFKYSTIKSKSDNTNSNVYDDASVTEKKSFLEIQDSETQKYCSSNSSSASPSTNIIESSAIQLVPKFLCGNATIDENATAIPVLKSQSGNRSKFQHNSVSQMNGSNSNVTMSAVSYENITAPPTPNTKEDREEGEVIKYFRSGTYNVPMKNKQFNRRNLVTTNKPSTEVERSSFTPKAILKPPGISNIQNGIFPGHCFEKTVHNNNNNYLNSAIKNSETYSDFSTFSCKTEVPEPNMQNSVRKILTQNKESNMQKTNNSHEGEGSVYDRPAVRKSPTKTAVKTSVISKKSPLFRKKISLIQKEGIKSRIISIPANFSPRKRKLSIQKKDKMSNNKEKGKLNEYLLNKEDWPVWMCSNSRGGLSELMKMKLQSVLNKMWNSNEAEFVKYEVKNEPNYYHIVKRPIFLSDIAMKLRNGVYETVYQFVHDFRRIFNNLKIYNMETLSSDTLSKILDSKFTSLIEEQLPDFDFSKITGDPEEINIDPKLMYLAYTYHSPHSARRKMLKEKSFQLNAACSSNSL